VRDTVSVAQAATLQEAVLPERVQEALGELVGAAKEGVLALSGTTRRSPSRIANSVLCKPCSNGSPVPRSVARPSAAITSAARTRSPPGDATSDTQQ
jgi:hypothetical protein